MRIALTVLAAWGALAVVFLVIGGLAVRDAQNHLGRAKRELAPDHLKSVEAPNAKATADSLARAHTMFGSPVVAPLKFLPVLGRQLRAIDAIAHAGNVAAEVGLDARARLRPIVAAPPTDGPARLKAVASIRNIAHEGSSRLKKLDFGPTSHLLSPISNTRAKFAVELNRVGELLQRADSGAAGLEKFFKGPSRYAVFVANNSEMRAGSGMLLSGGTLDVVDGEIKLGPMRSFSELPPAPNNVALEYDFLRLWGPQAPGSDYRFVNMTPRFPTSGALLQRMWKESGAEPVDGVLVLDPVAAVELIKAVGRLNVDGQAVTAKNATSLMLHDQYLQYDPKTRQQAARRDFQGEVVQQLFEKLNAGAISPTKLGTSLGRAATGRHILAWSSDTGIQRAWSAVRMDGVLPDQSVMFALQNRAGNKLDYFQKVEASAKAAVGDGGSVIDMEFVITNTVPEDEPAYIAGPVPDTLAREAGMYIGIAAIDVPANAANVKLSGGDFDLVSGPDGNMQVVSQWLELARGEKVTLKLTFSLPPGYQALSIEPSARVPEVMWHAGKQSWTDKSAKIITW